MCDNIRKLTIPGITAFHAYKPAAAKNPVNVWGGAMMAPPSEKSVLFTAFVYAAHL
jgi:hypothetical protein